MTSPDPLPPAVIVAAPASGSGKTTLVLALLRALRDRGMRVAACKVGPDYIDPQFHAAAAGRPCFNLDSWAMRRSTLEATIAAAAAGADLLIVEGVMGLFDGGRGGRGSTADLAALTGWPVVLVVDARAQAQSAAALVHGFRGFRPAAAPKAVIFNRLGSPGHAALIAEAMAGSGVPILGMVERTAALTLPDRHLGLVGAAEMPDLPGFLAGAARWAAAHIDLDGFCALAGPLRAAGADPAGTAAWDLPAPGRRVAVAEDVAFPFFYPHVRVAWQRQGATLIPFSPLADQGPDPGCDAVVLPGGYPELHAARLAANAGFLGGLRASAARGATVYGECGGYMVLGEGLEDAEGRRHVMAGLLPVETSFARRRLHLGYRRLTLCAADWLGPAGTIWRGHEFHFASLLAEATEAPLFTAGDPDGAVTAAAGCRRGRVTGSFLHLIDREHGTA